MNERRDYFAGRPFVLIAIAILSVAAIAYIWVARFTFQDDAYIHLRIAKNLVTHGFYSFNGDHPSFCTSSPLYTLLLGLSWLIFQNNLVPKFLNIAVYVALFAMIARLAMTAPTRTARAFAIVFLAAISSPLAMRWLTDGMETGLVGVVSLLLAGFAFSVVNGSQDHILRQTMAALTLGLVATLLRVEFAFIISLIFAASLFEFGRTRTINRPVAGLALGSALGLATIRSVFGSFLPDTAVAKAGAVASLSVVENVAATIVNIGKAHAAASMLGMLVLGAWAASWMLIAYSAQRRRSAMLLNCGFLLFVALVVLRHQAVQGYRYFVFIEFFLLAFNILVLGNEKRPVLPTLPLMSRASTGITLAMVGLIFIAWQTFDLQKMKVISAGRGTTFERFATSDWSFLKGKPGIAWDVGMIGFFGDALILDANGLVNGRAIAGMPMRDRLELYVSQNAVQFLFVNKDQMKEIADLIDVSRWSVRGQFDFPNFSEDPDRHFLLMRN
jgi:hypothetical protein